MNITNLPFEGYANHFYEFIHFLFWNFPYSVFVTISSSRLLALPVNGAIAKNGKNKTNDNGNVSLLVYVHSRLFSLTL